MALKPFIVCDACKKDIVVDDAPHYTREEFTRVYQAGDKEIVTRLDRRDLCEICMRRAKQVFMSELSQYQWLLDKFEVTRR